MEWNKILEYEDDIKSIALRWAIRTDFSLLEDAVQDCMLVMSEEVDISNATGPEREYVRGAIWNIIQKFFRQQEKWDFTSLDTLLSSGIQIDSSKKVIKSSRSLSGKSFVALNRNSRKG